MNISAAIVTIYCQFGWVGFTERQAWMRCVTQHILLESVHKAFCVPGWVFLIKLLEFVDVETLNSHVSSRI